MEFKEVEEDKIKDDFRISSMFPELQKLIILDALDRGYKEVAFDLMERMAGKYLAEDYLHQDE